MRMLLISAAFGIPIQFLLQFHGLARTTVSHASLMVGCHARAAGRRGGGSLPASGSTGVGWSRCSRPPWVRL